VPLLAVVHLSDIHIAAGNEIVLTRVKDIQAAVRGQIVEECGILLIISGDVAYAGTKNQYDVASRFVNEVSAALDLIPRAKLIGTVIVPGNHDCDFTEEGDARPNLLAAVAAHLDGFDLGGESIRQLLRVQRNFFAFEASLSGQDRKTRDQLSWNTSLSYGSNKIEVKAYNTSLFSRIREQPGQLHFPLTAVSDAHQPGDIVLTVFHHPYPWLEPNNAKALKRRVEASSDLVLTGHEHDGDSYVRSNRQGEETGYVEGCALHTTGVTGFNLITVDLANSTYQVYRHDWVGDMYVSSPAKARVFTRKQSLIDSRFENNADFARKLNELGTGFVHPESNKELTLRDLFVYPDLKIASLTAKATVGIQSSNVFSYISGKTYIHIAGAPTSGKSTLARALYLDFQDQNFVPLLLNATALKDSSIPYLQRALEKAFADQYRPDLQDRFKQLAPDRKVLIIDDWHRCRLSAKAKKRMLDSARGLFERLIIFTDDASLLQMLAESANEDEGVSEAEYCEIKQLGYKLRSELIRKWHTIDPNYPADDLELTSKISTSENLLDTLVRKGIVPSWPIFILSVLQTNSLATEETASYGSYGHLYEALLTKRLAGASKRPSSLGLKFTYLSAIAYELFTTGKATLSEGDLLRLHHKYETEYQLTQNTDELWNELIAAQVLTRSGDEFWFQYKYAYYFFIAKYFQEGISNIHDAESLRSQLSDMVRCVHDEDCSNVLIFYLYLTKDRDLIEQMLSVASRIYSDKPPANLIDDVEFVNRLRYQMPDILLRRENIEHNRTEYRSRLDESDEIAENKPQEQLIAKTEYRDDIPDSIKIQFAFKSLYVMGQVVKNFPLDLRGDLKLSLTKESYTLTLRTLRFFLNGIEANVAEFLDMLEASLRKFEPFARKQPEELRDAAGQAMVRLTEMAIFGMIKRLSLAIGVVDLKRTYEQVKEDLGEHNIPARLIDLSIKLDHFNSIPGDIIALEQDLKGNITAYTILRLLVAEFLYLFPCDYKTEQKMIKLFSFQPARLMLGEKKVRRKPD
jgi:hypothetical protein